MNGDVVAEPIEATTELAWQINDLWDDEGCDWKVRHEGGDWPWHVYLTWATEYGNPHQADFAEYTWQFYGDTVEEALADAVKWLDELAPWQPCGECDGLGAWNGKPCNVCHATGLANSATSDPSPSDAPTTDSERDIGPESTPTGDTEADDG